MGNCLGKDEPAPATRQRPASPGKSSPGKNSKTGAARSPNKVQGGSRVHIRAQDPTVKLALKIIHLPQEIRSSGFLVGGDGRVGGEGDVHKTLVRNNSGVLLDSGLTNGSANPVPDLQAGQVAYMPASFSGQEVPPVGLGSAANLDQIQADFFKSSVDKRQITHYRTGSGPRTEDFVIELKNMNIASVPPTEGNDYLYNPETHPAEFDAINTLAVSQLLLNLTRRCLWENGEMDPPTWRWGKEPVIVYPYASRIPTAVYSVSTDGKTPGQIDYGYFIQGEDTMFFCRSFDAIAHETGHAILDGIKPALNTESLLEGLALQEAFADLCAVFGVLDQVDICEEILVQSKGDLHNKNFLPIIADSYGPQGIRNIDNNLRVSDVEAEPHSLSIVVSGSVYDVIADVFAKNAERRELSQDAQLLSDIGRHLYGVLLRAYKEAPDTKIKLRDISRAMIAIEKDEFTKERLEFQFERRELLELDINPLPRIRSDLNLVAGCCDTLKHMFKIEEPVPPPNVSVVSVQTW